MKGEEKKRIKWAKGGGGGGPCVAAISLSLSLSLVYSRTSSACVRKRNERESIVLVHSSQSRHYFRSSGLQSVVSEWENRGAVWRECAQHSFCFPSWIRRLSLSFLLAVLFFVWCNRNKQKQPKTKQFATAKINKHNTARLGSSHLVSSPFPPNRILLLVVSVDGLAWKRQTTTKRRDAGKEEETESFPLLPLFLLLFWSFILFLMVRTETTTSVLPSTNNRIVTEREREREGLFRVVSLVSLLLFSFNSSPRYTHTVTLGEEV